MSNIDFLEIKDHWVIDVYGFVVKLGRAFIQVMHTFRDSRLQVQ